MKENIEISHYWLFVKWIQWIPITKLREKIIWTNAALLSIGSSGTNFSEIGMEIQNFTSMKSAFENVIYESGVHFVEGEMR